MTLKKTSSKPSDNYAYKNITISGLPGCGSTTILELLKEELGEEGWKGFSGGQFMRMYAEENGLYSKDNKLHHAATTYGADFDREVDYGMRDKLKNQQGWILESWLSGFMAQNVPGTLKVLMACSDDSVRIDRIVNRDDVTVESAKSHIIERYNLNLNKWREVYDKEWQKWVVEKGKAKSADPIDFWLPDLYDIVIDTYSNSQQQSLRLVLDALKKKDK